MTSGPLPKICGSLASKFSTIPFSLAFRDGGSRIGAHGWKLALVERSHLGERMFLLREKRSPLPWRAMAENWSTFFTL